MENFKVGDRVVCVDNSDWRGYGKQPKLVLNREYIVYGVEFCTVCGQQTIDVGLLSGASFGRCKCGNVSKHIDNIHWCGSWRFKKVAEKIEYITVAVDVKIEEPILN
jgi:hypothetical protein